MHRAHATILALCFLFATLTAVSVFMSWHEVRDADLGGALACTFMPDCESSPGTYTTETHNGLDHEGLFILLLVGACYSFASVVLVLRDHVVGLVASAMLALFSVAVAGASLAAASLSHILGSEEQLAGGMIHQASAAALALLAIALLVVQSFVFARARRQRRLAGR